MPHLQLKISADRVTVAEHPHRLNEPTVSEVKVLIAGDSFESRDNVLKLRDPSLQRISETHRSYDALQYPLPFRYGEDGYRFLSRQVNLQTRWPTAKKASANDFYTYYLMVHDEAFNSLHRHKSLFQQFVVGMYVKIESECLNFIRFSQARLRADEYIHLRDAIRTDGNAENVG